MERVSYPELRVALTAILRRGLAAGPCPADARVAPPDDDRIARRRRRLLAGLAIGLLAFLSPASAAVFVVTTTAGTDGDVCTSPCSLRQAVNAANLQPDADIIQFNIAGTGPFTIQTYVPQITAPVTIDGYSQPGASPNTRTDFASDAVIMLAVVSNPIEIYSKNVVVRGLSLGQSGTVAIGVFGAAGSGAVRIVGNYFGLAPDGESGFRIYYCIDQTATSVEIGGEAPADRNVFANCQGGIQLSGTSSTTVLNNVFGTSASGAVPQGLEQAITMWQSAVAIVGSDTAPNVFRHNQRAIVVTGTSSGSRLYANHMTDTSGPAIDLGFNGVTPNDPDDTDAGPNDLQNFPVLDSADVTDLGLTVSGSLDIPPSANDAQYRIALYESPTCDPSGYGEGETYLGSQLVSLSGSAPEGERFTISLAVLPPIPGHAITATATNPAGSTSELSACITASGPRQPFVVRSTADTGGTTCGPDCTLRQAINAANLKPGSDTINFDIPGAGLHNIPVGSSLPEITGPVLIDGYSQPGSSVNTRVDEDYDAVIRVQVRGYHTLFTLCADDSEIRGLSLAALPDFGPEVAAIDVGGTCAGKGMHSRIVGNVIGLVPGGNGFTADGGVAVAGTAVSIGGPAPADRNLISRTLRGVTLVNADGSEVLNNVFGLDNGGDAPNSLAVGVWSSSDVTVGREFAPNRFYFSGTAVQVEGDGVGNELFANQFTNDDRAIDLLGFGGVTPNDPDDADTGPNDLQNFPVLSHVQWSGSGVSVSGTLDVPAGVNAANYRIALYESFSCAPSGHGEGDRYLGSALVTLSGTPASAEQFTVTLPTPQLTPGYVVTATATNPGGSTSEFSECIRVPPPLPDTVFVNGFDA